MRTIHALLAVVVLLPLRPARAAEDVDVTAGVVTGLDCALAAREKGDLRRLTSCPPAQAAKGIVVFDVAERRIYRIGGTKVFRYQLESAFGGGSIDFAGKVTSVDAREVATVEVAEFSITKKPKPGAFKGCL
jgi:hypothetical protein